MSSLRCTPAVPRFLTATGLQDGGAAGGTQLQLRAEGYNVTNTPNFAPPGNALGTPTFGRVSSNGNSIARQMQFAVKLVF